jgi:DNA-binding transcriptional MerR regulator
MIERSENMDKNMLSIGEVSRLLNIPKDTLRYFDKEGIVKAKKGNNNYRYYDDWDINFLIEYKKYRGFGFNVINTKEILYEDSLDELRNKMIHNVSELERTIKQYQLILNKNQRYIKHLTHIEEKINQYIITDMVYIHYLPMRYNNSYLCKKDVSELMNDWMNYFPLIDPILVIENPLLNDYECALSISEEYNKDIQLNFNHLIKHTHHSKAINTIIVAGDKNTFSTHLLDPIYQYIKDRGYIINGPIIGYYLARVHENKEYKRYIDVFIPIK